MSDETERNIRTVSEPSVWSIETMQEIDYPFEEDLRTGRIIDEEMNFPGLMHEKLARIDGSQFSEAERKRIAELIETVSANAASPSEQDEAVDFLVRSRLAKQDREITI